METPLRDTLLRSRMAVALIAQLQASWPNAVDLGPSVLAEPADKAVDAAFVEVVHDLVDEGLLMIEALLVGTGDRPEARAAVLTRKGATVLFQVNRPL